MTSSNFFRHSFFHQQEQNATKQSNNQLIEPWSSYEGIPTQASKIKTYIETLESINERPIVKRRPSNLLPERSLPAKHIELLPPVSSGKMESKKILSELKMRGLLVQEFMIQRRSQKEQLDTINLHSMQSINECLQNSFVSKSTRKRGTFRYKNSIDFQKDLLRPLQIFRTQQVVEISPEIGKHRREAGSSLNKYQPLRSERYQL